MGTARDSAAASLLSEDASGPEPVREANQRVRSSGAAKRRPDTAAGVSLGVF